MTPAIADKQLLLVALDKDLLEVGLASVWWHWCINDRCIRSCAP